MDLGRIGIWHVFDRVPTTEVRKAVAEIESLGFKTVWIPEAMGRDALVASTVMLSATSTLNVATGIANLHMRPSIGMNSAWRTVSEAHPGRFLMGIGVSHQPLVEGVLGGAYSKPYSMMVNYLDAMDSSMFFGTEAAIAPARMLAALGPKMLKLSAERTLGAHPYFVPVEHTAFARSVLGPDPVLAPEVAVVITDDPTDGRNIARQYMKMYLTLPNYTNNLKRFGWSESDFAEMPDHFVDAIVPCGNLDYVTERLKAHLDAGATHVCAQILTGSMEVLPYKQWQQLAKATQGI